MLLLRGWVNRPSPSAADKAYLSRKNAQAVEDAGAVPFVPFKSNSLPPAEDSAWSRMYHYFMFNCEQFLAHYHHRSSVESAFSMVEAKFGGSIRSKSDTGQVNEALCKILCHNICVLINATQALGVEASFAPNNVTYLPAR
jgi:transposase